MNRFAIGHVLIQTRRLAQAVENFRALGFTVTYRTDPAKAHNALIYLQDGSFLELFNPKPINLPDSLLTTVFQLLRPFHPAMVNRFLYYLNSPEGLNDYALDSINPAQAMININYIKHQGAKLGKTINMSKTLATGQKQTWWTAVPREPRLPFFMSDYEPAVTCTTEEVTHRNGALGIHKLVINVPDLEAWMSKYTPFIGEAMSVKTEETCTITIGKNHIILLRQANQYGISEIHILTSHQMENPIQLAPNQALGSTIFMTSI